MSIPFCTYKYVFNTQYAVFSLLRNWEKTTANKRIAGGVFMDPSKTFLKHI